MRSGYTRQSLTRQPQRAAESPAGRRGPGKALPARARSRGRGSRSPRRGNQPRPPR